VWVDQGGAISGNTSSDGGGVGVFNNSSFIMAGGEISGNSAARNAGAVYVFASSIFTM
jgi:hypothetical protein